MKQWLVRWTLAICLGAMASMASAYTTETLEVLSTKMKKVVPVTVVLPNSYKAGNQNFPVLYMLHGAGDDQNSWVDRTPIGELADIYQFMVVCPDAGKTSWYFDSPDDPSYQYETFTSSELVRYIDAHYRTRAKRGSRAVCGNSMGGHGALFLAIRHSNVFGIAVGMSGGYDLRPFSTKWDISKRIGAFQQHPDRWEQLSVVTVARSLKNRQIAISFECGVGDSFFIDNNRALHNLLLDMKIDHEYTERPGVHGWVYWRPNIRYQAMFIAERFREAVNPPAPVITPVQPPAPAPTQAVQTPAATPTAKPTAKATVKEAPAAKPSVASPSNRTTEPATKHNAANGQPK